MTITSQRALGLGWFMGCWRMDTGRRRIVGQTCLILGRRWLESLDRDSCMPPARRAVAFATLLAAGAARAALAATALTLTPCQIEHPLRLSSLTAECGVLE